MKMGRTKMRTAPYYPGNYTGFGATNPNLKNPSTNLPNADGTCPVCSLPWWMVALAALGVVETAVVLLTRK